MFVFVLKYHPENFAFLVLKFSSNLPVKFLLFLKRRLIFNIFYCFCMFANKIFKLNNSYDYECKIFRVVFLYEHEHIERISNLHKCTSKDFFSKCDQI